MAALIPDERYVMLALLDFFQATQNATGSTDLQAEEALLANS